MIKVVATGHVAQDLADVQHAINFSEEIREVCVVGSEETVPVGVLGPPYTGAFYGGIAVNRGVFRQRQPDARWVIYGAGLTLPTDGNALTVDLLYLPDTIAPAVVLTSAVAPASGAAYAKHAFGPVDVFGTVGVPAGETVPIILLGARKAAGAAGFLACWNLWLRLLPSLQ